MPTFFDTLLPGLAVDTVAVFDQNFQRVFQNARSMKVIVKEEAKVMQHPVESGATITDHRIILPVEIELSLFLGADSYQDTYRTIKQFYLNSTLLVVQTKSSVYENQLISSIPHEESPEQYDVILLAMTLRQVQFANTSTAFSPKSTSNNSTVQRGTQQGVPTTLDRSTLDSFAHWAGGKFT